MGVKTSLLKVCKCLSWVVPPGESSLVGKATNLGPEDDTINKADGYLYFTPKQEQLYEKVLRERGVFPEQSPPLHWQSSRTLGAGSYGHVLFATDLCTGELMAVKKVPFDSKNRSVHEKIREIQEEVEILSQLHHKNIVQYLGTERDHEYLYIFMEYAVGGSIANLLKNYGTFNETLIRVYTKQILEGLEYLHCNKIIHRDIKGANILVGENGVCKLADFGAAKRIIGEGRERYLSLKGTANYMAPEVVRQDGHGRFADIWSLGCLIVEMATGKAPFSHISNEYALLMYISSSNEAPSLTEEFSDSLRDFIAKCFRNNPSERANVCELLQHEFIVAEPLYTTRKRDHTGSEIGFGESSTRNGITFEIERTEHDQDLTHNINPPFGSVLPIEKLGEDPLEEEKEISFITPSSLSDSMSSQDMLGEKEKRSPRWNSSSVTRNLQVTKETDQVQWRVSAESKD